MRPHPVRAPPPQPADPSPGPVSAPGGPAAPGGVRRCWHYSRCTHAHAFLRHRSVSSPERFGRDLNRLYQEVIQHLAAPEGVDLEITVEISASKKDGFPDDKARIVSRECPHAQVRPVRLRGPLTFTDHASQPFPKGQYPKAIGPEWVHTRRTVSGRDRRGKRSARPSGVGVSVQILVGACASKARWGTLRSPTACLPSPGRCERLAGWPPRGRRRPGVAAAAPRGGRRRPGPSPPARSPARAGRSWTAARPGGRRPAGTQRSAASARR